MNNGWTDVKDDMPGTDTVLAYYVNEAGNYRIVKAFHAGKFEVEISPEDENPDYDEEEDCYYYPEGWYEVIDNWDDYGSVLVQYEVTFWRALPEPPFEVIVQ